MIRAPIFEAIRSARIDKSFDTPEVLAIDEFLDRMGVPREVSGLTERGAGELVSHEAIVQEAYRDSEGIWTWSVGLTAASGVDPLQFKDKPASLEACLAAFIERTRARYVPDVHRAFAGKVLTEAQFAAALSFHYNTGAILRSDWVTLFLAGKVKEARAFLESHYLNGGTLTDRRKKEAALFFDGKWSGDGTALVIPVSKPSYQPAFGRAKRVDIRQAIKEAMS